nr:astra-associated protein 1 [Quercus suber]
MAGHVHVQSSSLPPALPTYILRGHGAQIHALHFFRKNLRLVSGDAEGWVVVWDVSIKRPTADERDYSTTLPIDDAETERKKPWLLHSLTVNALNFCSFASNLMPLEPDGPQEELVLAVPGVEDGAINVTSLPSESRIATIPPPSGTQTGMLMAVALHFPASTKDKRDFTVLAGYESGLVAMWTRPPSAAQARTWQAIFLHQAHAQPVLSIAVDAINGVWFSSSADATLGKYTLAASSSSSSSKDEQPVLLKTKHAGQQALCVRGDGKILATAGWDGRGRVYGVKAFRELAVLKWHKEGMYATAFADVHVEDSGVLEDEKSTQSTEGVVVKKRPLTVVEQRVAKTQSTHWLAAGSKDGKISLWDIY